MLAGTLMMAANAVAQKVETLAIKARLVADDIDINALVSGEGAAADGGALSTLNNAVKSYGQGGVTLVRNLGIFAVVIAVALLGISFAIFSGDAQKNSENKKRVFPVLIGIVLVVGAIGIVSIFASIGMGITDNIANS